MGSMGLNVNRSNAAELVFKDAYCSQVAIRLGKKMWSFPKRWDCQVESAISNAELCKASVSDFVKAQFTNLPETFCLRIFNSNYPPIGVFSGERARRRYRSYIMDQESKATKPSGMTDVAMKETIRREVKAIVLRKGDAVSGGIDVEVLSLLFSSGSVSPLTISYLWIHQQITSGQVEYIVEGMPEEDRARAMELIVSYKKVVPTTKIGL